MGRHFTSHQVAGLVQVSPSAVLRWIDQGLLQAFRTPGGHRRVREPELLQFLRSQKLPIPTELSPALSLLVIDDEVRFLGALELMLRQEHPGVRVEVADNPIDGLLKVGLLRPNVVLLDAYMPGMDGLEVCRRLKASPQTRDIAVIATSGSSSPELVEAFHKEGACGFLPKPLSAQELIRTLRQTQLLGTPPSSSSDTLEGPRGIAARPRSSS